MSQIVTWVLDAALFPPTAGSALAARKKRNEMSPVPPATSSSRVPGDGPAYMHAPEAYRQYRAVRVAEGGWRTAEGGGRGSIGGVLPGICAPL